MNRRVSMGALVLAAILHLAPTAGAQYFDGTATRNPADFSSREWVHVELRIGPYEPDGGSAFERFFDDQGPLLAFEVDAILYGWKDIASVGVGTGFGWTFYSDNAQLEEGSASTLQVSEETDLTLYPIPVVAFARIDALSRLFNIPLIFTGKLGADFVFWQSSTGDVRKENLSIGLRWAAQVAFELDWFDRRAARNLDEELGINHTTLFFEMFGSTADSTLPVGPDAGWAWTAGLGLTI